jgi:hypothetical protein
MKVTPPNSKSITVAVCLVSKVLIVGVLPGLCAEETYAIKFERHKPRIGLEYQFRAEIHDSEGMSFKSETRSQRTNTTSDIELAAHCKVLAIAEDSQSVEMVIEYLTERQGTNLNALLAPHTVVIAKKVAAASFFTVEHVPVSPAVAKVLERFLSSASDGSDCTADRAFGTPELKKIGDTWKASTECAIKSLSKGFGIVEPNQFDVTVKLLGVEEAAGTKCLRLGCSSFLHTEKPIPRIAKNPTSRFPNAKWDNLLHFEAISLLPLDQDLPSLRMEEKGDAVFKVEYSSAKGPAVLEMHQAEQRRVDVKVLH